MKQNIEKMTDCLPSREEVANLSPEELFDLVFHLLDRLESKEQEIQDLRQDYEVRLAEMLRTMHDLMRKLNTNSTNSGIPPSKDPIGFDRSSDTDDDKDDKGDKDDKAGNDGGPPPATSKPRKRGGQKGHKGHGIHFFSPDEVLESRVPESSAIVAGGPQSHLPSIFSSRRGAQACAVAPQDEARKALRGRVAGELRSAVGFAL